MALTLMYITNRPEVACIAQKAGVDRIWVDMEYIGKEERQAGMNTVKSHHTIQDICKIRSVITSSELLVRVNPIHNKSDSYCASEEEIEEAIQNGADVIMLPMFKTKEEVVRFFSIVRRRVKTILLLETAEAVENIDAIIRLSDIDEIHIGLNDLHLAYRKKFMFELLSDGTVEKLCKKFKERGIKYGFGGIARVGYGELPAEYIIGEHYRLGSSMAILSRGFCNANLTPDVCVIERAFSDGIQGIREKEQYFSNCPSKVLEINRFKVEQIVKEIVDKK